MARFLRNKKALVGQVPGDTIFIGEQRVDTVELNLIDYDANNLEERAFEVVNEVSSYKDKQSVTWLNTYGLHDTKKINEFGNIFGLHPLTMEDILNTGQRPKMEEYDIYLFFTMKMIYFSDEKEKIAAEQISIVLGDKYFLTFQERRGDVFTPVRMRIRQDKGRIRKNGCDYLAYAIIDTIIDNYLVVISSLGDKIESLESDILSDPSQQVLSKIYSYKQEVSYLRKSIRPAKRFILQLEKLDSDLINETTKPFLKDLMDLTTQATEAIEVYSDMLSDHLELYNSVINNKLNEIMKVLTIFSVIFIPLTFIAGIYGTNFEYLPELKYKYSYFIFWAVMIFTASMMLLFFKRKKWI